MVHSSDITLFNCLKDNDLSLDIRKIITCGIDVGSVTSKAALSINGQLYCYSIVNTGSSSPHSAMNALNLLLNSCGIKIDDINYIVATGYGRVNVPFAHKIITEITCHGKGANYIGGSTVKTVLDIGGQDCKVIHIDEAGKVINFLMNDRCAAGTGRGIEVIADLLNIPLADTGQLSLEIDAEPPAVSNICVVFARSEALSLLKRGYSRNFVLASYMRAMAERLSALVMRIGLKPDLLITGGVSKNIGIVKRIENILGIEALKPTIDTQIAGALGASLLAYEIFMKIEKV